MPVALSHYETLSILNADLNDDALKSIITSATSIIEDAKGTIHKVDEWGRRRLAYPISKRKDGFYFLMTYSSSIEPRREMERRFKLNEDVMRFQTIAIDEAAVEAVKESIAKEAEAKAAAEKEAALREAAEKETAAVKETAEKETAAVKEAAVLVESAAKAVPETKEEEIVDPAIKAASDLIEAAAQAAPAPGGKDASEDAGGDEKADDEGGTDG